MNQQHNKIEYAKIKIRYHRAKMNFKILSKIMKRNKRRKHLEVEVAHLIKNIDLYINDDYPYFELAEYATLDIERLESINV
jgi:hypothetical protein